MKKKILLLLVIFCLVGCTAEYNVIIKEDYSIKESIELSGDNRFSLSNNYTIDSMFGVVKNTYSNYYDPKDLNSIDRFNKDGNLAVSLKKEYANLDEYTKSYYLKLMYADGLTVVENDDLITIKSSGVMENFDLLLPGMEEEAKIEQFKFNLKLPYLVTNSNADSIDEKTNTFTWNYDFNSSSKTINITFDKTKMFDYKESDDMFRMILIVAGVVLVIGIIVAYILYNKKKKNDLI